MHAGKWLPPFLEYRKEIEMCSQTVQRNVEHLLEMCCVEGQRQRSTMKEAQGQLTIIRQLLQQPPIIANNQDEPIVLELCDGKVKCGDLVKVRGRPFVFGGTQNKTVVKSKLTERGSVNNENGKYSGSGMKNSIEDKNINKMGRENERNSRKRQMSPVVSSVSLRTGRTDPRSKVNTQTTTLSSVSSVQSFPSDIASCTYSDYRDEEQIDSSVNADSFANTAQSPIRMYTTPT